MRFNVSFAAFALLIVPALAFGHGEPIDFDADAQGNLFPAKKLFFGHGTEFTPFDATRQRFQAGFGISVPSSTVPVGTAINFDVTGDPTAIGPNYAGQALLYWNGTSVVPTDEILTITRSATTIDVDQLDTFLPGAAVGAYSGAAGWHGTVNFFLPLDAPQGLYAAGFRISAPDFTTSETFWVVGNVGLSEEDFARGVAALSQVVPEPSTWIMAVVGLAGVVGATLRRKK